MEIHFEYDYKMINVNYSECKHFKEKKMVLCCEHIITSNQLDSS